MNKFWHHWEGLFWLTMALALAVLGGVPLYRQRAEHSLPIAIPANAKFHLLSEWAPWLKGTRGDTEVYILAAEGATAENSGSLLLLGGTHPDEPAGHVSAMVALSTAKMERGRLFIIPRANASGFSTTEPGEGHPPFYTLPVADGKTIHVQFGSRLTNMLDQWPTPDVKPHVPSGQLLSGKDLRNLNRCFPGDSCGLFTERVTAGITAMVMAEKIDLTIDMHEASLEYPVINALIAHENSMELASTALMELDGEDLKYSFEPSPQKLRGLSHRELGDHTNTKPILVETANVAQGRLRGKTTNEMIVQGADAAYFKAVATGLLKVDYPETGISLETRCGRHLSAINAYIAAWTETVPDRPLIVTGIPKFTDLQNRKVGEFLRVK